MKKTISVIGVILLCVATISAVTPNKKRSSHSAVKSKTTAVTKVKTHKPVTKTDSIMNNEDAIVEMQTSMGPVVLRLYGDTPKHRDNFLKNVKEGVYDGLLFHRVIKDFMVQGGDPDSRNAAADKMLGGGDLGYTLEAEIVYPKHFHKYGALAAARTGDEVNPDRRSSASQFYIVTGKKYDEAALQSMEAASIRKQQQGYFNRLASQHQEEIRKMYAAQDTAGLTALQQQLTEKTMNEFKPVKMTPEMIEAYTTVGGTPHLDGQYTVYGEVVSGMDVVEKIQNSATGKADRPIEDIKIISIKIKEK